VAGSQVVPRHDGAMPNLVSFVTPGVCTMRVTVDGEQPCRRDVGFCAPGSCIIVKVSDGGGGLDWLVDRDAEKQASQRFIDVWRSSIRQISPGVASRRFIDGFDKDLLNQPKVGPFDARFHDLLVGRRRVALPADPGETARVLSEVRALAFAAGLLPGRILIPAAFRPGFSLGQRVRRPVTGREGVIDEYNRGSRSCYRMTREKWSAPFHELEPLS